jgi:excisionase family DNA binding protein
METNEWIKQQSERLERIETLLEAGFKDTLTFDEAAEYIGMSKSYLYKLTSAGRVPHYKPTGKMLFFDRAELQAWQRRNRVKSVEEVEREAAQTVKHLNKGQQL